MSDFSLYNNIGRTLPLATSHGPSASRRTGGSFGDVLRNAIQQANDPEKGTQTQIAKALNQDSDLRSVMSSLQQADLSFQVMMQVRNRIIQAYEEIMRMPV